MRELAMQFPRIADMRIYDGVWHGIEPVRLWEIVECSRLYLLEYIDKKFGEKYKTFLRRGHSGFHNLPLLRNSGVMEDFEGSLELLNTSILPSQIDTLDASYDWLDMALRLSSCDTGVHAVKNEFSVSTRRLGNDPRYVLDAIDYGVITLFIKDSYIYLGEFGFNGLRFIAPFLEVVTGYLSKYCIIWRRIDFSLITDDEEIQEALDICEKVSKERGNYCDILEVMVPNTNDMDASFRGGGRWPYKLLPSWLRDQVHRYDVYYESQAK